MLTGGQSPDDQGPPAPGVAAGFDAEAFERFSRADEGRTGAGAGLGLAIVKAIADAHGGRVSVVRSDGTGATVRVELPLDGTAGEPRRGQSSSAPESSSAARR